MCGIAGILTQEAKDDYGQNLSAMLEALHHRGPDGRGQIHQGQIAIGMTRLAIIDVAGGQQPILNETGDIAIVCNGEIYNHAVLRTELEARGHRFRTHSDVEVILHLYEERGQDCFRRLNGMFAAAIADFRNGTIVLGRDPFGQKPLYIWSNGSTTAFASELKALTVLPGFSRNLNPLALASYLHYRYVPHPLAAFANVEKLSPGSSCLLSPGGGSRTERYFQLRFSRPRQTGEDDENGSKTRQQLRESVDRHLMSERPLGVFLSGGLDSSAIVSSMWDLGHRQIHTFTVGCEGYDDNEFETARVVSQRFETDHTEITLNPKQFTDTLAEVVYWADEPLTDLSTVPLFHLSAKARESVVVVLSGEGADELLGGYGGTEQIELKFRRQEQWRKLALLARLLRPLPWRGRMRTGIDAITGTDADYLARHLWSATHVFPEELRRSHGADTVRDLCVTEPLRRFYAQHPQWDGLHLVLAAQIEWWLPDDLLHKADRMSMANSIELRCPFLDVEFASFCSTLRAEHKVRGGIPEPNRKIALKRAFRDLLPDGIALQRKRGFTIAAYQWLENELAPYAEHQLLRKEALGNSLISEEYRRQILTESRAGSGPAQHRAWNLILLNLWGDRWL